MARELYTSREFEEVTGVRSYTLRHWIRRKLLTKPVGKGRAARYLNHHVLQARAIQALRSQRLSLNKIKTRIAVLSDEELFVLAPPVTNTNGPVGVPEPPPAPNYPCKTWEVVPLTDGLLLMVIPSKGPIVQRIANEIYQHYGTKPSADRVDYRSMR